MRQVALRDFRLKGAKALGRLGPGEAILLSGRQGPAYYLVPVDPGAAEAQEAELRTALALAAMRESWRKAEAAGLSGMSMEEINEEIASYRRDASTRKGGSRP